MGGHGDRSLYQGTSTERSPLALPSGRTLKSNVAKLSQMHPTTKGGRFGKAGRGSARLIESDDPMRSAWEFALAASNNPMSTSTIAGKGIIWTMRDESRVVLRFFSSSDGSPVVELFASRSAGIPTQKIHFVRKGRQG